MAMQLRQKLGYTADGKKIGVQFLAWAKDFLFSTASSLTMRPTYTTIQWLPEALPHPKVKQPEQKTNH
jgi:hypothetical protein